MRYLASLFLLFCMSPSAFAVQVSISGGGVVYVDGTQQPDYIVVRQIGANVAVYEVVAGNQQQVAAYDISSVNAVIVEGYGGDDTIVHANGDFPFLAYGGEGRDRLYGANEDNGIELLHGGPGQDHLDGGRGYEVLYGGPGTDFLTLTGSNATDVAGGRMDGGADSDFLVGSPLDDIIVAADGNFDFIDCNGGSDFASPYSNHDSLDMIVNCDAIQVIEANRTTYASASYSSTTGSFPPVPIQDGENDSEDTTASGVWSSQVNAQALDEQYSPSPISAGTSQTSAVQSTGGSVLFELFEDGYLGNGYPWIHPFGQASSRSSYDVKFLAAENATLSIDGFMSYNIAPGPTASVYLRVIKHGTTDTVVLYAAVNPNAPTQGNRRVKDLNGTTVALQAGETYSIHVEGSTSNRYDGGNSEATADVTWSVN